MLDELPHGRALVERERLRGLVRRACRAPPANTRGEIVDARAAWCGVDASRSNPKKDAATNRAIASRDADDQAVL